MPRIRTGYSFRTAVGHLSEVADRLVEIGYPALPITDRDSTFGFANWTKLSEKKGLRPVYGVELGVVEAIGEKRPSPVYWTFLARSSLRPLHDLIGLASRRNMELRSEDALASSDVIVLAGERANPEYLPSGTLILLSPGTPVAVYRAARKRRLKFVAASDNMHTLRDDHEFYRVAMGKRSSAQTWPQHILSDEEWSESVSWFVDEKDQRAALKNRSAVLEQSTARLLPADLLVPEKPKSLEQLCREGAQQLRIDLGDEVYSRRLAHELRMIDEKRFADYFHVLIDIIGHSKKRMIVGPGRGSSSGSLVCYLTGITTIDPIVHDLMFERFIDTTRDELPDVDVDFSDQRRHIAFEYAEQKYGRDRVARLGSVGTYQAKSAFKQVAASLMIPSWKIDKMANSVIQRSAGDSRAAQTIEDSLANTEIGRALVAEFPEVRIVQRLEDHPTTAGQHAAGIVITQLPVAEHVAVDGRTGATMCDKYDADRLNLLKIDALGLTQLSVFERVLEMIGKPSVSGFLETLPLDDQAAFDVLNHYHFSGIFQFVGRAVRVLAEKLLRAGGRFDKFDDLVALTALARPGPLGSGMADEWVRRRAGLSPVTYTHPIFEPYLRNTHGVVIYQEQVMAIARELGDLSWGEVNQLRRAMSKSLGKEFFDSFGDKWKAGAASRGIPQEVLNRVWEELVNFGAMGFNKAHSVSYGVVSYWCLWLKAHHPVEFAAATLDSLSDPAEQIAMLRELKGEGIDYVSVDPENSTERWSRVEREGRTLLVGPLTSIRGIGPAAVRDIIESRREGKPLKPGIAKKLAEARTEIDSLYPIRDAIKRCLSTARSRREVLEAKLLLSAEEEAELRQVRLVSLIESRPTDIAVVHEKSTAMDNWEVMIMAVLTKIDQLNENELLRVQKRGGRRVDDPSESLQIFASDDSGELFCKVHRKDFEEIGRPISEKGGAGKAIYALKGRLWCNGELNMLWVKRARYVGDLR